MAVVVGSPDMESNSGAKPKIEGALSRVNRKITAFPIIGVDAVCRGTLCSARNPSSLKLAYLDVPNLLEEALSAVGCYNA